MSEAFSATSYGTVDFSDLGLEKEQSVKFVQAFERTPLGAPEADSGRDMTEWTASTEVTIAGNKETISGSAYSKEEAVEDLKKNVKANL